MRKLLLLLALAAVVGLLFYSLYHPAPPLDPAYVEQLRQARARKDQQLRQSPDSPLADSQKTTFAGLRYFPPAAAFRVTAQLKRQANPLSQPLEMLHAGAPAEAYETWATAEFELLGVHQHLTLLRMPGAQELFVPFLDPTNGPETYAGGRYLDLPLPAEGAQEIELDFNRAYAPYCAYSPNYACPKPPADNRLTVPVRAGEQLYRP